MAEILAQEAIHLSLMHLIRYNIDPTILEMVIPLKSQPISYTEGKA